MRDVLGIDAAWTPTQPSNVTLAVKALSGRQLRAIAASYTQAVARMPLERRTATVSPHSCGNRAPCNARGGTLAATNSAASRWRRNSATGRPGRRRVAVMSTEVRLLIASFFYIPGRPLSANYGFSCDFLARSAVAAPDAAGRLLDMIPGLPHRLRP